MSEEPDLVGTMLGSYRILGELSRGGMGAVYRAEHAVLERPVAVKLLRPELSSNPELVARFVNEAKAASAIRHPGIIEVLDFGHALDGRAYFVMEMLEGESLAQRIELRGKLPEREAALLARGIAAALAAAHATRIVHRDLKPDNIYLIADPDVGERPKVLDFGIAKLADGVRYTQTGALMGTPLYMAPEQARAAGAIDSRADLYSLGCILYEMLVGEPPFVATGAGEIIALQMFGTARPPRERADVSAAIDRIVMRLLDKEPDQRFQTAAEVVAALDDVLGERRPAAPTPRAAAEQPRRARPLGLVAALAVVTLVALGVGAFVLTRDDEPEPAPAPPVMQQPVVATPAPVPPPPVEAKPATREKSRAATPKPRPAPAKHTKAGSPIEIDLD